MAINDVEKAFVIGGGQIYNEAFENKLCRQLYLTKLGIDFECDTFIKKEILKEFRHLESSKTYSEKKIPFNF